jgi:GT2 family glycosyltransferase
MTDRPRTRPTVAVVTWQGKHLLPACLDSLRRQTLPHEVLVVDNASTDGTADLLRERYPEVRVLRLPRNTGFAGGFQAALDATGSPYLALLNNDAVAEPEWLARLVEHLDAHPEAAAVSSRMFLAGTEPAVLNNTGVVLLQTGYGADRGLGEPAKAYPEPGEVFGFSGGAALLRTAAVRAIGGVPVPFFLYYEDTDVSWRLRSAGWSIRYEPSAVVHHRHAASSDLRSPMFAYLNERNRLLMLARCAPAPMALRAWARFLLTTASLAVRQARRGHREAAHNLRVGLRLRALGSAVRHLGWALSSRSRNARSTVDVPVLSSPASG